MRARVAAQALLINFLCRVLRGIEDLGGIAAAVNVRLACPMAVFAGYAIAAVHLGHLGVRVVCKFLAHLVVAGGTGLRADKIARSSLCFSRLRFRSGSSQRYCAKYASAQHQNQKSSQSPPDFRDRTK